MSSWENYFGLVGWQNNNNLSLRAGKSKNKDIGNLGKETCA